MFPKNDISHLVCECGKLKGLGISPRMKDYCFCSVGQVFIDSKSSKLIGRGEGDYVSIFCGDFSALDGEALNEITQKTAEELSLLCGKYTQKGRCAKLLVVGLGNGKIVHDALGALVCKKLVPDENICVFPVGVASETGLDTASVVRSVAESSRAELVIAVDSLAANSEERLGRVIQLCDSGIFAGSGVGNENNEISLKTIGIPVISIGAPTALKPSESDKKNYLLVSGDVLGLCKKASVIISDSIKIYFNHEI